MPERWEHELKKLRKVEQPSTLEDRVAEGPHPHREPGRSTRDRVAAAVVAFAVCAAFGVFGYRTLSNDDADGGSNVATGVPSGDETLVLELATSLGQPSAMLLYGDERQDGVFESTNWCPNGTSDGAECSSSIADFAFFPPVNAFLVVPPGTPIELTGNGSVDAWQIEEAMGGHLVDGSESGESPLAHVPGVDGRYAINVGAHWALGDANVWFGVQVLSSESAAPDMLTVDCSLGLAQTDTSVVRTQPNGLAIQVVNDNGTSDIEVRSADGEVAARDAGLDYHPGVGWGAAPGRYTVGCGRDPSPDAMAAFELVDPDDHYAPWDLACGEVRPTSFISGVPTSTPHDQAVLEIVQGLRDGDRMRGAGYGAETFKLGPTYVVDRGGASVARIVLGEANGVWVGTLAACPESAVTFLNATPAPAVTGATGAQVATGPSGATGSRVTGSTGSVDARPADVLVVRCEGPGPALDASSVRLQPDGRLRYEATNVADAEWVMFEGEDPMHVMHDNKGGQPFDTTTVTGSMKGFAPGTYWVGCRVIDASGGIPESHLDHPEAYTSFEVLPADADA